MTKDIERDILKEFWQGIRKEDRNYLKSKLGYETGTLAINVEDSLKRLIKLYFSWNIKRLKQDKKILMIVNNQLKDEVRELKNKINKGICSNCKNVGKYQGGGTKRKLFWWCSKKCEKEFYKRYKEKKPTQKINNKKVKK